MAIQIIIPSESQSMESALIVRWHVKVGDKVKFSQVICEVESEKASFEIEAPANGTILAILYEEQSVAPVLMPIAIIGKPDEDYQSLLASNVKPNINEKAEKEKPDIDNEKQENKVETIVETKYIYTNGKKQASPRAKKLAIEKRIDINEIEKEIVLEKDVMGYMNSNNNATSAAKKYMKENSISFNDIGSGIGGRATIDDVLNKNEIQNKEDISNIKISAKRKFISEKMIKSIQTTAQFTLHFDTEATNLLKVRNRIKENNLNDNSISINDMLLFATAKALAQFPEINATFDNNTITKSNIVHLGFAVDLPDGLVVPVIKGIENMSLNQISKNTKLLISKCKNGSITSNEMSGGTFTVSNLGAMGIGYFTPILNTPEVAILGVGKIELRPIRSGEQIVYVDILNLSLTLNHQIIDGAAGARFIKILRKNIENIDILAFM